MTLALLKGDRREQTDLRKAGGETMSWEAITATIGKLSSQDWEKLEAGHGNGVWAPPFMLPNYLSQKATKDTKTEWKRRKGRQQR